MRVGTATSQGRTVMKNFDTRRKRLSRRTFVKQTGAAAGAVALFGGQAPAFAAGKHKLRYIAFINRNTVWGSPTTSSPRKSIGCREGSSRSSTRAART